MMNFYDSPCINEGLSYGPIEIPGSIQSLGDDDKIRAQYHTSKDSRI
jgi:hypothetical protein